LGDGHLGELTSLLGQRHPPEQVVGAGRGRKGRILVGKRATAREGGLLDRSRDDERGEKGE
jgi:hypothetical protein